MNSQEFSADQQEVIDLIRNEIAELVDIDSSCLKDGDVAQQQALIHEYQIHLDHVSNALQLAGLEGLAYCTKRLVQIFRALRSQQAAIPQSLTYPVRGWGQYFVGYLQYLGQAEKEAGFINDLLVFLSQKGLPCAMKPEEANEARELFARSDLSKIEETPALPTEVTEAMVALTIHADTSEELLRGMLIELPGQIQQFDSSISSFLESGDFADLQQAQRIAHTIKGAANIVSISGIANLTHYTEDLLETAAKNPSQVPNDFDTLLVKTSDCLATTAEFLNRQGPKPTDLQEVMQELLDWLNQLRQSSSSPLDEGLDSAKVAKESAFSTSQEPAQKATEAHQQPPKLSSWQGSSDTTPAVTETAHNEVPESEHYINLQEKTAQELLRLSGEMQIASNQMETKIEGIVTGLNLTDRYHKLIKNMAAEFETLVQTQSALRAASAKYTDNEIDPLEMERFSELHTLSNRLLELTTDSYEAITNIEQQIKDLSAVAHSQQQLNQDNQHILLAMNLVPISSVSARFSRCVRQTCRLTGKLARLEIVGETLLIDSRVLMRITDPIMHLLRNAIDHGLENSSEERLAKDKSAEGLITLSFVNKGDTIEITCEDDGQGLNYDKIKQTAVDRGLVAEQTDTKENLLNQLIMIPGFSTRQVATQTSGRGIGLDSVVSEIRALKGSMNISSEAGCGCKFSIVVPTSILNSHALLVQCQDRNIDRTYGIVTRGIRQIIYVDQEEVRNTADGLLFDYGEEQVPVRTLSELLGLYSLQDELISALLMTERTDGTLLAIGVEKVIASQDLVVKPLNRFSHQVPGVIGATILGDGTISPVIDIHDLPGMALSQEELKQLQERRIRMVQAERASYVEPPAALVVDDSLSARRSLAQFVSDMGMEVFTAKDGFDAISVIENKKPSLMLVDLEMPRMNGLELTAHLRAREEYRDIPVIMITSRSTSRHKELAQDAGVTAYLTKPWSDDELLSSIQKQIA